MIRKLQDLGDHMLAKIMAGIGRYLFRYVVTWSPPGVKRIAVIMFAESERDFNCAVRDQVDRLDGKHKPERTDDESSS
jgi:hypothetical protein